MGLITLRPFPHMISAPPQVWRYFHASSYRFFANPGVGITTTIDGETWTAPTLPTLQNLSYDPFKVVGFAYNNALVFAHSFVRSKNPTFVSSYQSLLWHSFDNVAWDQTTASERPCSDIATGGGLFVSVNTAPRSRLISTTMVSTPSSWKPISTSTDGFNWFEQQIPLAIEDQYNQVLYAESEFKVIGNSSILRSNDGSNWIQQPVNFPESYYTSIEGDVNDVYNSELLNSPSFSKIAYGNGKYVYTSISPRSVGACAADVLNVSIMAGTATVTNNTGYGCNWIVNCSNAGINVIRISNSSYTNVVAKIKLHAGDIFDHISMVKMPVVYDSVNFDPIYHEYISGTNTRTDFVTIPGGGTIELTLDIIGVVSAFSNEFPSVVIQAYPDYQYDIVAHSTPDFIGFTTSSPIIFDTRPNYNRIMAYGFALDRWVLWLNTHVAEDNCRYDYVVYSTDGVIWHRATSFALTRVNQTNPGFAEIYPSFSSHENIEKPYQIGYEGGAVMSSSNGTDWVGWVPTPLVVI